MALTALPPAVSALEARLGLPAGTLAAEDLIRATAALEDATTLAVAEVHEATATRWEANGAPAVVALVILKAARREFENPRGLSQESLGEHSVSLGESSGVYLTAREVAQIRRAVTGAKSFVGSIATPSAFE